MRLFFAALLLCSSAFAEPIASPAPLPIDPLWKSETFRKAITGGFGIDSRIEPRVSEDEQFYLEKSAEAMAANDRAQAIQVLKDSSLVERSAAIQFQLASLQFEEGDLESATQNLNGTIEQFPNFRDAHRNLGIALVRQNKVDEAFPHLVRAIELGSRDGMTMGLLGYYHSTKENHQAALDSYRQAALTQPNERQWKLGEAQALQSLGQSKGAVQILQQLLDELPTDLNLWLLQADVWVSLENSIAALANLELALRAGSLSPSATLSLGHLYLKADLPDLALERYETAIKGTPAVTLAESLDAVEILLALQDFERTAHLLSVIEESPLSDTASTAKASTEVAGRFHRAKALIEIEIGDPDKGAEQLSTWLDTDPTDGLALILLARYYENSGEREEAEMRLEQAAAFPDHAAEAHRAHGKLLVDAGKYKAALGHLEKSLSLAPSESLSAYIAAVRELAE